jgi:DNA-binding response OmpR family regulator
MTFEKCRVLCVEDDEDTCQMLQVLLREHEVKTAASAEQALALSLRASFDLYILDYWVGGVELCQQLKAFDPETPVLYFTGEAHDAEKEKALSAGADAYLVKPNDLENLVGRVEQLVQNKCGAAAA